MAAAADALDNLLAGVAAFGEADVSCFEGGFVRDHRVVEIDGEPGDAGFEAKGVERLHADGGAVLRVGGGMEILPDDFELFARGDDFCAGGIAVRRAEMRAADQVAGNRVDGDLGESHFGEAVERKAGGLRDDRGGLGAFDGERAELAGGVFEGDVVHDDEFVEDLDDFFADGRVGADEELFFQGIDFELGKDVPLRIEEQSEGAAAFAEGLDVVRYDGVEVADAVGAAKDDRGVPVGVDEGDRFARGTIFAVEIGENLREDAAEIVGEPGAFGEFEFCERRFHTIL